MMSFFPENSKYQGTNHCLKKYLLVKLSNKVIHSANKYWYNISLKTLTLAVIIQMGNISNGRWAVSYFTLREALLFPIGKLEGYVFT